MILLDSDHLTILATPGTEACGRLSRRIATSTDPLITPTIVSAEEQLRGWLAEINRLRTPHEQIRAYEGLRKWLAFLRPYTFIRFDERAADEFLRLRQMKIRIGTMDLKIACIALVHDALLVSANLRDFQQVPGLRVEDWMKE